MKNLGALAPVLGAISRHDSLSNNFKGDNLGTAISGLPSNCRSEIQLVNAAFPSASV